MVDFGTLWTCRKASTPERNGTIVRLSDRYTTRATVSRATPLPLRLPRAIGSASIRVDRQNSDSQPNRYCPAVTCAETVVVAENILSLGTSIGDTDWYPEAVTVRTK